MSATSFSISWLEVPVGWMMGGVINGGDFSWDFIFDAVTQVDKEEEEDEAREESGSAILRDPGPGLTGVSGMTLTNEYTGTVTVLEETAELEEAAPDLRVP